MLQKRIIVAVLLLALSISIVGCGGQTTAPTEPEKPQYKLFTQMDIIPPAYVDVSYDLGQVIIEQDDVEYKYKATYTDPESGKEKKLTVKNRKMTPKVFTDIYVTVTAELGYDTETTEFIIPITTEADVMDTLLTGNGKADTADDGVTKEIAWETDYLKAEGSVSSMKVTFSNPADSENGTKLFDLSNSSLMAYYSSRVWDNSAVTMWVYNPMEQDVALKLTSYDSANDKTLLWNSVDNTQIQYAKAGQWTQVAFSLYQMDIRQVLYHSVEQNRTDSLELHARYTGNETCTLYFDGIDIVDALHIENLQTGYIDPTLPDGDFSDLLSTCKVYNGDNEAVLEKSKNGNGSPDSYRFGSDVSIGYPTFYVDLPQETDISGFDYMKFDVYAEKSYPNISVSIRYIDENGEVKHHGTSFDFYREKWRTLYVNLDYLNEVDLTRVVGFNFSIHLANQFIENEYNCVYFDNFSLYEHEQNEPELRAPVQEDHDLISGPMLPTNIKIGTSGVCKVAEDEEGNSRSNSALLFWTNNACGYPNVYTTFRFDYAQDWSKSNVLSFDTHQFNGHYWMGFTLFVLDEEGNESTLFWRHDTVLTHWMTNSAPLSWFTKEDGSPAEPEDFKRVVGLKIAVDMAVNVTDEVALIFFDNFYVS